MVMEGMWALIVVMMAVVSGSNVVFEEGTRMPRRMGRGAMEEGGMWYFYATSGAG